MLSLLRHGAIVAAIAMLSAHSAAAQRITPPPSGHAGGQLVPIVGAQYGAPERFAGVLGLGVSTAGSGDAWAGYAVIADAGQGGARLSFATIDRGPTGLGAEVRLSAIRTWRTSIVVAPSQTFVGPELRLSFTALTVGAGYYWRTAGRVTGDNRFAAVTFGIGM
jgi:hypothetical protein